MTTSLAAGLELMLIGMGTVFAFLTLLIGATALMSTMVGRPVAERELALDPLGSDPTEEELAIIGAAVTRHRQTSRSLPLQ